VDPRRRVFFSGTKAVHPYIETSLQAGRTKTDFQSGDLTDAGGLTRYETRANYAGAHVGVGAVWEIPDIAMLDLSGKYLFTHRRGDKLVLSTGDPIEFDAVESKRLRLGGRYTWKLERAQPYVGFSWEHEYDNETKATSYGQPIEAPSLEGNTRTVEFGMSLRASPVSPLSIDLNVPCHSGKRFSVSQNRRVGCACASLLETTLFTCLPCGKQPRSRGVRMLK
jgi:hypothetical protein